MKKFLTLSLVLVMALGANAKIKPGAMAVHRSAPAVSAKQFNVADKNVKSIDGRMTIPKKASETGLKRLKADENAPFFEKPLGTYYNGFDGEGSGYQGNYFLFAPAYTNIQFIASSPESGYQWTYVDPENPTNEDESENFLTSRDKILNLDYGNIFYATPPVLSVGTDTCFQSLYYYTQGGVAGYSDTRATNSRMDWDGFYYNLNVTNMNSADGNTWWTSALGVDTAYLKGTAEYLPYLGTPYWLNAVSAIAHCKTTEGGVGGDITLAVIKAEANEDGTFKGATDEILCTATATLEPNSSGIVLNFQDLIYEDPETGAEDLLIIDCPVIVCIFANDAIFDVLFPLHPEEHQLDNHALMYVEFDYEGEQYGDFFDFNGAWGTDYQSSWAMSYEIYHYYLHNNTLGDETTYNVPAEGETKTFQFDSYYSSQAWDICTPDWDDLPEWINVECEDGTYEYEGETYYTGLTDVTITVDALPEGVESREQDVMFIYDGAKYILHVVQGDVPVVPSEFYMVGTFNEWNTNEDGGRLAFVATDEDGVYEVTGVELEAAAEFKVITPDGENWKWYGGVDENGVGYFLINNDLMNVALQMTDGSNFRMENAGKYTFRINANDLTLTVVPETTPAIVGDVNGDGFVTSSDVTTLYDYLLTGDTTYLVNGDVNGDGFVTSADVTAVYDILLGSAK